MVQDTQHSRIVGVIIAFNSKDCFKDAEFMILCECWSYTTQIFYFAVVSIVQPV